MNVPLPTLDQIAGDARCVCDLAPDALAKLLARTAAVQSAIAAQLLLTNGNGASPGESAEADTMLTVSEAAQILRRAPKWIWRHQELPFVRKLSGRSLLISKRGLMKWLAARRTK